MAVYARVAGGVVMELFSPPSGVAITDCFHAGLTWVDVTSVSPSPQPSWTATEAAGAWSFAPPPAPPAPTLAQQAQAALGTGLAIISTATPALSGTYACDAAAQAKFNSMFNLIQRAGGGAFPASLTALPWPDIAGAVHTFTAVADFLNLETAIGDYVLALDLIITTSTGTLPPATATIA